MCTGDKEVAVSLRQENKDRAGESRGIIEMY